MEVADESTELCRDFLLKLIFFLLFLFTFSFFFPSNVSCSQFLLRTNIYM